MTKLKEQQLSLARTFQANLVLSAPGAVARQDGWVLVEKTGPEPRDYTLHGFTTSSHEAQQWEDKNPEGQRGNPASVVLVPANSL